MTTLFLIDNFLIILILFKKLTVFIAAMQTDLWHMREKSQRELNYTGVLLRPQINQYPPIHGIEITRIMGMLKIGKINLTILELLAKLVIKIKHREINSKIF